MRAALFFTNREKASCHKDRPFNSDEEDKFSDNFTIFCLFIIIYCNLIFGSIHA